MADRLAEIAAREAAATPGPWEQYPEYGEHFYANLTGSYLEGIGDLNFGDGDQAKADLEFTINARTDVPWLIAELAKARGEVRDLRAKLAVRERQLNDLDMGVVA